MNVPDFARRSLDVLIGTLFLAVVLPVIVVGAAGSAITLRAWPFFTQDRVGRNGRIFRFVKLRTLPKHTPPYANKYELTAVDVPRFTERLRRLHLDELPQLFLVVTGKMSLVGPRPEMPHLHGLFTDEFAALRTSVRPGCTGLWQISEHCPRLIYEHPEVDRHYLGNRSVRLDLWIMWCTVRLLLPLGGKRLYSLSELPVWARRRPTEPARRETTLQPSKL